MASFTERFKRVRASGSAKHYIDTATGEEVTYRQALKRSKAANLTRKAQPEARKSVSTKRAREYHADVREFADRWNRRHKKNKITYRQSQTNGQFLLEQKIKRYERVKAFETQLPANINSIPEARAAYERAVRYVGHDVTGRSVSRAGVRHRARVSLFRATELRV